MPVGMLNGSKKPNARIAGRGPSNMLPERRPDPRFTDHEEGDEGDRHAERSPDAIEERRPVHRSLRAVTLDRNARSASVQSEATHEPCREAAALHMGVDARV